MLVSSIVTAQTSFREDFEGPATSWKIIDADVGYRIEAHTRDQTQAHGGNLCERISVTARAGSYIYAAHDVGQARVVRQLRPTLWVRSNRAGPQILARVVLPRTINPKSRKAATVLVRGSGYSQPGRWQNLLIDNLPLLVERQARVLRLQFAAPVDTRDAYVDAILLNIYGQGGTTTVWIDDLDLAGFVGKLPTADVTANTATDSQDPWASRSSRGEQTGTTRRITLQDSVLLLDGKPMYPRIIEYQGEPLEFLRSLGFNAIRLDEPPPADLLDEARRNRMWIVCAPPVQIPDEFDRSFAPVLAWDLGKALSKRELRETATRARLVAKADRLLARPLVCQADTDLRAYSRYVNLLIVGRDVLGTSLELADYARWLRERPRLARPGTPVWTTIQTQLPRQTAAQLAAITGGPTPTLGFDSSQLRLLVHTAIASGSRGLCFESWSPLDADDRATKHRALLLRVINHQTSIIEPWLTEGQTVALARETTSHILAPVLHWRRGRLLMPGRYTPGSQYATSPLPTGKTTLIVPGVPETNQVHLLTPVGLRSTSHHRVTGGTGVKLEGFVDHAMVVVTHDPVLISDLSRRTARMRRQTAAMELELAQLDLTAAEQTLRGLPRENTAAGQRDVSRSLAAARHSLGQSNSAKARGDDSATYRGAREATAWLDRLKHTAWTQASGALPRFTSSPATGTFAALPWHWRMIDRLRQNKPGSNLLVGGDCESLQTMLDAGWRHYRHSPDDLDAQVELSASAPFAGALSLHLSAAARDEKQSPGLIETAPVWITSAPVQVAAGTMIRISGRVRIPRPITGSIDGLMIVDSVGGHSLSLRFGQAAEWQEFSMFRITTDGRPVHVTFAMTGIGDAWIDQVMIQPIGPMIASGL